jgi:hypothetical protein
LHWRTTLMEKKIGLKLERREGSDFYWKCLVAPLIS